jgi:type IV secretory pathway VirB4 component
MANEPSTADLIQIQELRDGVLLLKDGSLRAVVKVSAVNFELRSSDEQAAILQQFGSFLNSIDFPIQMVVHSRRYDISAYLATVRAASEQLTNELLKVQAGEYIRFVAELSDLANIMQKNFYVVLPLAVTPTSESKGFFAGFKDAFKKTPTVQGIPPEQLASYKMQLQQRADLIIGGLSGMGLKGAMLEQDELVALFNDVYNPVVPASPQSNS